MAERYDAPRRGEQSWRAPGPDRSPWDAPAREYGGAYGRGFARGYGRDERWREEAPYAPGERAAYRGQSPARETRFRGGAMSPPRGPYRVTPRPDLRESGPPPGRGGAWRSRPEPPRRTSLRHEDFRRESERDAGLHYFGTGAPGVGGTGFTGGRYGYGDDRSWPGPGRDDVDLYREGYPGQPVPEWARESRPARAPAVQWPSRRRYPQGPKGYQRSDERLREDISERLLQSDHIDSSDVTVEVAGGKVRLEGTVPERPMKHAIEDLVDACPGVQDIENRLKVRA